MKGVRTLQSVEDSRASSRGHFRRARAFSNVTPPVLKMSQRLSGPAVRDVGVCERDSSGPHPASTVPGKKKNFSQLPTSASASLNNNIENIKQPHTKTWSTALKTV